MHHRLLLLATCSLLLPAHAVAQQAAGAAAAPSQQSTLSEIVVTATKRGEAVNTVPMSITALTAETLRDRQITQVSDLPKLTPGLQYSPTAFGTPIYTIRGVGFNETSLGATPTVSVYMDEAPLPYGQMAPIALFDLQRVEVLKGPQGTLFGQNSTGGALNFIAAKPTKTFEAGADLTANNFGEFQGTGYVSGPITSDLSMRLALKTDQGGAWQKSYTRGDSLGSANDLYARLLLTWTPTDLVNVNFNLSHYFDHGDGQAAQFRYLTPLNPASLRTNFPQLLTYPTAPASDRLADWDPAYKPQNDRAETVGILRADITLPASTTLTSLTEYAEYDQNDVVDPDGTSLDNYATKIHGVINTFSQELRLTGDRGPVHYIVGGNYTTTRVKQFNANFFTSNSNAYVLEEFGGILTSTSDRSLQTTSEKAIFGNVDYDVTHALKLHAGVRYTQHDIHFTGCSADEGNGEVAPIFTNLIDAIRAGSGQGPIAPIPPGGCVIVDDQNNVTAANEQFNQDNVSWRVGADWTVRPGTMLYANVSRGYKSGSFPLFEASLVNQYTPVSQESVLAYEAGFKAALLDHTLQANGAIFYYDYTDKQVLVETSVPIWGQLQRLVNIPKSKIEGAELDTTWRPMRGLTLSASGTYVYSQVTKGVGDVFTVFGEPLDINGESLPLTPKWQGNVDGTYEWQANDDHYMFVGGTFSFQSRTYGAFGSENELQINPRALLDIRFGLRAANDRWRLTFWGQNVTNQYYWTNAVRQADTTVRFTGRPATAGVTLSVRTW